MLSQLQIDDKRHPVSYASRALNAAEKKWNHRAGDPSSCVGDLPFPSLPIWERRHSLHRSHGSKGCAGGTQSNRKTRALVDTGLRQGCEECEDLLSSWKIEYERGCAFSEPLPVGSGCRDRRGRDSGVGHHY